MSGTTAAGDGADHPSVPGTPNASLSHLPWTMIPTFRPGETDINEYTKKLEFLASLWPPEHLSHLAPRAAMMCEGSSFKRVMRLDAAKLKVNSTDGVRLLVTALGGIWGKSTLEEKFERFERAIYTTVQRTDEAHESYLARHDYQFEELLQMGVKFEDIRAYILLRNSGLGAEDKKKLIVDSQGDLEYKAIVSSLKLLGSKFFHELQSNSKFPSRVKTYDVNAVFDDDLGSSALDDEQAFVGDTWDDPDQPYDESDPDAVICMQFEESLVDAMQADADLAACYNTYLEARKRITERSRNRGFWGNSKGFHTPKGKGKGKSKFPMRYRKPLAQRILESECRKCGAKGHWKAECPLNRSGAAGSQPSTSSNPGAFTGTVMGENDMMLENDMVLLNEAQGSKVCSRLVSERHVHMVLSQGSPSLSPSALSRFVSSLKSRLSPQRPERSQPEPMPVRPDLTAEVNFVSHGPYGIVDLGASQTVIGQQQVNELLQCLPKEIAQKTQRVPCETVFRFGNSSTVACQYALLVPLARWNVKICVVRSQTPFLISNNVFRTLGATIDTAKDTVFFSEIGVHMPLKLSEKKLYLLDFCELIRRNIQAGSQVSSSRSDRVRPVMHVSGDSDTPSHALEGQPIKSRSRNSVSDRMDLVIESQPLVSNSFDSDRDLSSTSVPSFQPHGDHEPCRPIPGLADAEEDSGVHGDVLCRPLSNAHLLRRDQGQSDLSGSDRRRPQVCAMARQEIPRESEGVPPGFPLLPEPLCGAQRAGIGPGDLPSTDAEQPAQVQGEGQTVSSPTNGPSEPRILVRGRHTVGCRVRGSSQDTADSGRDGGEHPPDQQHGECPDADHPTASGTDSGGNQFEIELLENGLHAEVLRSLMCDDLGDHMMKHDPDTVHDQEFFHDDVSTATTWSNWVIDEMWKYFRKKFPNYRLSDFDQHFSHSKIDLLEVYCSESSQLTHQCQALGMSSARFGLKQGDLSTFAGRANLYDVLWMLRPRHIWTSPKCGPWCAWSRLNMAKSVAMERQILKSRQAEKVHLCLCDALHSFQCWRGPLFHFHLEQPLGSELVHQDEMCNIVQHTLKAICDMCSAGHLKHPEYPKFLKKRTQILTTSKFMWRTLEQFQCLGTHQHDVIAGSCKAGNFGRMSVSKYSEMYTAVFGRRLGRAIRCSLQVKESAVSDYDLATSLPAVAFTSESKSDDLPEPKRRRLSGKYPPEQLFVPESPETFGPTMPESNESLQRAKLNQILHLAEQCAPRVGKVVIQEGPLLQHIQELYPDKQVMALDICRGVNRMRTCPVGSKGYAPFRRAIGKRRSDLSPFADDEWEHWEVLSHRQQIRNGTPSKILITVFASNKRLEQPDSTVPANMPAVKKVRFEEPDTVLDIPTSEATDKTTETTITKPAETSSNPMSNPKCHSHGPKFQALDPEIQNQIRKIHQNLGHPDNRVLQLALKRYGWTDTDVRGCADFVCPACFEKKQPKVSRPSHLHEPRDFNDLVSFDGAEWTDPNGKTYSFFHFIDSATNFHTAIAYQQRTTESLIHSFNTAWVRWAGPPKKLMFDSATESNSEEFSQYLQQQAIQSYVIPTEAHWQLGRAERHGAILKRMIDQYHADVPIKSHEDFEQCLIQLCNAKNSMSRHAGYTIRQSCGYLAR